jgi:hypothetical protein
MRRQVENRIADDLPGTVIRDVATAVGGLKFNVHLRQNTIGYPQMLGLPIAAQRNYMRMLAKKQNIGNRLRFACFNEAALQFERPRVGEEAPVEDPTSFVLLRHFID